MSRETSAVAYMEGLSGRTRFKDVSKSEMTKRRCKRVDWLINVEGWLQRDALIEVGLSGSRYFKHRGKCAGHG